MIEEQRRELERLVRNVLGKGNGDVVSLIEKGLGRGYDERKLKDRISDHVSSSDKAQKLAKSALELLKGGRSNRKRTKKFVEEPEDDKSAQNGHKNDSKKPRKTESTTVTEDVAGIKNTENSTSEETKEETSTDNAANPINPAYDLKVKEVMAEAQRMIEERKKKLNLPAHPVSLVLPSTSSTLAPAEAEHFMQQALDKAKRVAELKARIAGKLPGITLTDKPTSLILDNEGRAVDLKTGTAVPLNVRQPTLKANQRSTEVKRPSALSAAEPEPVFTAAEVSKPTEEQTAASATFLDPRLSVKGAQRPRRQFHFHEKGEFEQLANRQRAKAKLEKLQGEISEASKKTGISSAVKLAMVAPKQTDVSEIEVPDIEWWDAVLFPEGATNYDFVEEKEESGLAELSFDTSKTITNLVEHPIQLRPPTEPFAPQYIKVFLTTKERKKLRRQTRKEAQREKTEKIRLGLEAPPDAKVKISNLMRVLGTDAIKDPTKMEAHVREQMAKRLRKHEEANKARQLTPEQKTEKKVKKIQEDTSLGVHVAVFRVTDLAHPAKKFKVEVNAKQLYLTGSVVLHKDVNVVVVEGGPKQLKFFKNLMLKRIKWAETNVSAQKQRDRDPDKEPDKCTLVWEGMVKRRNFGDIKFKACPLEKQAREHFEKFGVPHYWDMAFSGAIMAQEIECLV